MSLSTNYPAIQPSLILDFANSGRLDPRITITRASPATYYDGVTTAVAEQNLYFNSTNISNATYWGNAGISITGNQLAPDGTNTAFSMIELVSAVEKTIFVTAGATIATTANTDYTTSVFFRPNGRNFAAIRIWQAGGQNYTRVFDISTGALAGQNTNGSVVTGVNSTITAVGGGWYRCSVTWRINTSTIMYPSFNISNSATPTYDTNGGPSYTGDGTSGIFIWGMQTEQRASTTGYTPTTTQPITNYIPVLITAPVNTARFDYNPVTNESLGLMKESEGTNLVSYSAAFDNAYWTKLGSTITPSTNVAPDGTLTAATMTFVSGTPQFFRTLTKAASAITYTISCYAKAYTASVFQLQLSDNITGQCTANFNLTTGVVTGTTAGTWTAQSGAITPVGNGWYRCSLTGTSPANTGLLPTFVCPNAGSIFVWGAQLEAASNVSSYIATTVTQDTRQRDDISMTGTNFSSWFNPSQGTLLLDIIKPNLEPSNRFSAALFTSSTEYIGLDYTTNPAVAGSAYWRVGATITTTSTVSGANMTGGGKYILTYIANDMTITAQGQSMVSVVPTTPIPGIIQLNLGAQSGSSFERTLIYFRKVAYYPLRLTNAQMQNLTESP